MATVYVGDDTDPFPVHHDLITATSDFFCKALNGEFMERNGVVRLPDHKSEQVSAYVQWLYEGHFEVDEKSLFPLFFLELARFGEFVQDRHFRNRVMDAFIYQYRASKSMPGGYTKGVFTGLPSSSS